MLLLIAETNSKRGSQGLELAEQTEDLTCQSKRIDVAQDDKVTARRDMSRS